MTYKSIVVTRRGGVAGIQVMDNDLRPPLAGEARIRVLATPVCQDDIAIRVGNRPFLRKPPYIPGYSFIGIVDAVGEDGTCTPFFGHFSATGTVTPRPGQLRHDEHLWCLVTKG